MVEGVGFRFQGVGFRVILRAGWSASSGFRCMVGFWGCSERLSKWNCDMAPW